MFPTVSIIIAVKTNNFFLEECVNKCMELDYPFFEIIILPDEAFEPNFAEHRTSITDNRINIIPTGNTLPAMKRDIGVSHAKGEILAFLDDDTYPEKNWLKYAVLNFKDESIACVGGPAVTPTDEPFLRKASGKIYESLIVSGPARFRYLPLNKRFTDDFPSCNFLMRKDIFMKTGGFNTKFWPGEDTILCLEIVHNLRKKIIYDPLVKIFHHRRNVFKKHLEQIANYALHRGYFVKKFPKTSLKMGYFLPSILTVGLGGFLIGGFLGDKRLFYGIISYIILVFIFSIQKGLKLTLYIFIGTILTHLVYGINFIKGLLAQKLKEE